MPNTLLPHRTYIFRFCVPRSPISAAGSCSCKYFHSVGLLCYTFQLHRILLRHSECFINPDRFFRFYSSLLSVLSCWPLRVGVSAFVSSFDYFTLVIELFFVSTLKVFQPNLVSLGLLHLPSPCSVIHSLCGVGVRAYQHTTLCRAPDERESSSF